MIEKIVQTSDYLTKSRLPDSDFVINPYVGCPHGCKYCYACFMKRFTNHKEPWGEFVDIKECDRAINLEKIRGKKLFLSSVTDCYNPIEEKFRITRGILQQLVNADCEITIGTKSDIILQDLQLLKSLKNLTVSVSLNTLDENFKNDMDKASSIQSRLNTLEILHNNGIKTVLFMSPIFPGITDFREIVNISKSYVDVFWFENLNLRGSFKAIILAYIKEKHPDLMPIYDEIYNKKNRGYWEDLSMQINEFCTLQKLNFVNYFYHEEIRKN